MNTAL